MALTSRRIGVALLILGISFGTVAIGPDLDDGTVFLRSDSQRELADFLAPAAGHTVGLALTLPGPAVVPSRHARPRDIESVARNGSGYDPPGPRRRGPPAA